MIRRLLAMFLPKRQPPSGLPPLDPVPTTRPDLIKTAPSHRATIRRADQALVLATILDDFRSMDGRLHRRSTDGS